MLGLRPARVSRHIIQAVFITALTFQLGVGPAYSARPVPSDADLIGVATNRCKLAKRPVNVKRLGVLLKLERKLGVPGYARGIILAAACRESGYRARPRRGDKGRAVGILQLWPWWERRYKIDRTNPIQSARAWLTHIGKSARKAARKCKAPWAAWLVAQAWVRSGPRGWRCRYSRHHRLLRHWRWVIRRQRKP